MVEINTDPYIEILQAAIDRENELVGVLFTRSKAESVGIHLDEHMVVQAYDGSGSLVVQGFIDLMARLGGNVTKKLIISAIQPVMEKYPEIKIDL